MNPVRSLSEAFTKKNYILCNNIIKSINIDSIDKKMQRGYVTLCLRYFYATENFESLEETMNSDFNFMKRDYMLYCKYLYDINLEKCKEVFVNSILSKESIFTVDIDFLIDNNFTELIKILDGYYVICSKDSVEFNINKIKKFDVINREEEIISHFINSIKSTVSHKFNFTPFIETIKKTDVIIDGGNVIFSTKQKNIQNIINVFTNTMKQFKNPLIIIHKRHKKFMIDNNFYHKYKKYIYLTPFSVYDDYFLILGMIINKIPIITNDKFRDHIFEIFKLFDSKNNQLSNYIKEMTLSYNKFSIDNVKNYSKCIQYDDNYIYIPTKDGFYIMEY